MNIEDYEPDPSEILTALENARLGIVDKTHDTPFAYEGWNVWEQMHTVALVAAIQQLIDKAVLAERKRIIENKEGE